jgi:hypothetical protein
VVQRSTPTVSHSDLPRFCVSTASRRPIISDPGSLAHLINRFFDVAFARPLNSSERDKVTQWLTPDTANLFFAQNVADQRHGHHAASLVQGGGGEDGDVIMAALLHDVGKRHARLGILGRSVASVLILLRLPLTVRMSWPGYRCRPWSSTSLCIITARDLPPSTHESGTSSWRPTNRQSRGRVFPGG